jgi:hypothetical protein
LNATYKSYKKTEIYINSPPKKEDKSLLYWNSIITFLEVKKDAFAAKDLIQAASYATVLPHGRPNLAGVLYLLVCKTGFVVAWSDASRIVCSQFKEWDDQNAQILFRYVLTLYDPVEGLPQVDTTVQLRRHDNGEFDWRIKAGGVWYIGEILRSSPAYGKQTTVWSVPYGVLNKRIHKRKGRRRV